MEQQPHTYLLKVPAHISAYGLMWQFLDGKNVQLYSPELRDGFLHMKIVLYHFEPTALTDFIFLGMTRPELERFGKPQIVPYVKIKRIVGRPRKQPPVDTGSLLIAFPNGSTLSKAN